MKEAEKLVQQKSYFQAKDLYVSIFEETKNPAAAINATIMFRANDDWKGGLDWLRSASAGLSD
jgi:hypothetical protein